MGDAPRPNIQALRALGTQNHQSGLTPALLTLFVSRGPLKQVEYTRKRKPYGYTGASRARAPAPPACPARLHRCTP